MPCLFGRMEIIMKKLIFAALIVAILSMFCVSALADDAIVYSATELYNYTSTAGGLALKPELVNHDGSLYISVYVNGTVAQGADGTQFQFKVGELSGESFKLKDYPIFKMSYVSNAKDASRIDVNLGMNYSGSATRLWGYMPEYKRDNKNAELIFDLSKSFTGGESLNPSYSWDNVDDDSPVNYMRMKPFTGNAAMNEGEYIDIEYIGFFKTMKDAENYVYEGSDEIELTSIKLNFEAIRTNPGKSFDLVAIPKPTFASLSGVTFSSENNDIATVDANGKVTAVAAGDTYIVAKTENGLEVKCHVHVLSGKLPAVHFVPKNTASSKVVVNCLGDSITTYAPSPDGGMNYHDWWGKEYNVTNNDYGISGASLTSNGQNPFVGRYMNMTDDADLVIVKGGTNDFGITALGELNDKSTSTYIGAVRTLMEGLIEKYPNSQIVFLTPIRRCEGYQTVDTKNGFGNTLNDYANAVVMLGELYGIPTVNIYAPDELDFTSTVITKSYTDSDGVWHGTVCESDLMPDGLHPSGKGHKILADYILNELSEKGVIAVHNTDFTDTVSHWGCTYIDTVARLGLFKGVTESEFSPNGTMTRAMAVTVLSRLANDTENKSDIPYADVNADAWFRDGVAFAYSQGIVDSGDTFRPDDNITREELADMLYRFAKNDGKSVSLAEIDFADNDAISSTCSDGVAYCVNSGIIKGYDDNTFKPDASATRAEVATMIVRFINA